MFTTNALNKRIMGFITSLELKGYSVKKVVLFGSYASGKPHKHSDIDLAVWLKYSLDKHFTEVSELLYIVSSHHPIKPIFYSSTETASTDPFIGVIEKTGKQV